MDIKFGTGATGTAKMDRSNEGLYVNGTKVIGLQGTVIADLAALTGGESPTEAEANADRTAINAILARLRAHGLIATS